MSEGWIRFYRQITNSKIWQRPDYMRVFMFLLLEAHYDLKPEKIHGIEVKRGQTIKSLSKIQEGTIWQENNKIKMLDTPRISKILKWLEQEQMISKMATGLATLVSITNYESYQPLATGLATDWQQTGNHTERKEERKNINLLRKLIDDQKISEDFLPVFEMWFKYKKDRKESYKNETSINTFCKKLIKMSDSSVETATEIIEQSIGNNWAGIFPLKDDKGVCINGSNERSSSKEFITLENSRFAKRAREIEARESNV